MFDFEQLQQFQQIQRSGMFPTVQLPTVSDVEKFQPQRGATMVVMAQDKPVFALKVADRMGVVSSNWYKYEPYNPEQDRPQYITRDELEEVLAKFTQTLVTPTKKSSDNKSNVKET